jgi:glyoxylase-like metal-dependent hydrolase (beta-lactamase superfamily II)
VANGAVPDLVARKLTGTRGGYAYYVPGSAPILVDSGLPGRGPAILEECRSFGGPPAHIVITHYDVDHMGSAAWLQDACGATVWVPAGDAPYIAGERARPGVKRVIAKLVRLTPPKAPRILHDGDVVGSLTALASPGHTPGHLAFAGADFVAVGDALTVRGGRPVPLARLLTWDPTRAEESVRALTAGGPRWILPAHAEPFWWDGTAIVGG